MLRAHARDRGVGVVLASAGFRERGHPVTDPTSDAAARRGLDVSAHRSAVIDRPAVRAADLVLAMERRHVREIVVLEPAAWPRTFTAKELVRRGEAVGPRPSPGQPIGEWLELVHRGRQRRDLLGASPVDDVADPTEDWAVDHEVVADELEDLTRRIAALLWPDPAERR
jgi:protein-tyrosine phosphatase